VSKQGPGKKAGGNKAPAPEALPKEKPEAETVIPESAETDAAQAAGGAEGGEAADIEDPLKETETKRA